MRIGEILIGCQLIHANELDEALELAGVKALPVGRALISLKYLSEDNLVRGLDCQIAIRLGLNTEIAIPVLRYSYQTNRTYFEALKSWPGLVGREKIPPELMTALSEKSLEQTKIQPKPNLGPKKLTTMAAPETRSYSQQDIISRIQQHQPKPIFPTAANRSGSNPATESAGRVPAAHSVSEVPATKAAPGALPGGDTQSTDNLIKEADKLFADNKVVPAEKAYALALRQLDDTYGAPPSKTTSVMTKLANLYVSIGRQDEADPLYQRILESQTKVFGPNSMEVALVVELMADVRVAQKRLTQAQSLLERALQIVQQQKWIDLQLAGRLLKKLGPCYGEPKANQRTRIGELAVDANLLTTDKVQEALAAAREMGAMVGVAMRTLNLLDAQQLESLMLAQLLVKQGTIPAPVAVLALKLAVVGKVPLRQLCDAGKWLSGGTDSDVLYQTLVVEHENLLMAEATLGADHPEVTATVLRIADLHLARKDRVSAELFIKRALGTLQKAQTPDPISLARLSEKLAQNYCQQGKFVEAQPLLLKSLEYRKSVGAGETVESAKCLWLVAKVELAQYNHATALSFLRSAKLMFNKVSADSCPSQLLEELAQCCKETGVPVE